MSNIELRDCHCGGRPSLHRFNDGTYPADYYSYQCGSCGEAAGDFRFQEAAAEGWNRRVGVEAARRSVPLPPARTTV